MTLAEMKKNTFFSTKHGEVRIFGAVTKRAEPGHGAGECQVFEGMRKEKFGY